MTTLPEIVAAELARHCPNLGTDEISSYTVAICAANAYAAREGKLEPTSREAIQQILHFAPKKFLHNVATAAAESATSPAAKTVAYLNGTGQTIDSVFGGGGGLTPDVAAAVRGDVESMDAAWARTAARLGFAGKIEEALG